MKSIYLFTKTNKVQHDEGKNSFEIFLRDLKILLEEFIPSQYVHTETQMVKSEVESKLFLSTGEWR